MEEFAWFPPPDSGMRARFVEANGLQFELVEAGAEGDRLAICLHGFPELNLSWRHQIPLLAEQGWRVWAPNLRGYGASARPKGAAAYHIDTLTEDIGALIDAAKAERPAFEVMLIAHDWGGAIAWDLAMRRVRPLDRLVVMNMPHPFTFARSLRLSPAQRRRSWYVFFFQLPKLPEALMRANGARAVRQAFRGMAANPERFPSDILDIYAAAALRPGAMTAMINYYRAIRMARGRVAASDPRVDVPTLLVWGTADEALGLETLDGIHAYLPDLTLKFLPGISHWVQQDAPEEVNAILRDWLT
ncbi:MAG: alpha/beta fold hydrolase [Leptolyngbya sp. SIO4C5]|nr:alpha/beta fold hydrolase [Leptolyngbya sp. SIO4C5]